MMDDDALKKVVGRLAERFGRYPTEQEVIAFINGSDEERAAIWNKEKKNG